MALPVMVTVPVEPLLTPYVFIAVPPVTSPVIVTVAVEPLCIPKDELTVPPVALPLRTKVPVAVKETPCLELLEAPPPVTFPVTVRPKPAPFISQAVTSGPVVMLPMMTFPVDVLVEKIPLEAPG